MVTQRSDMCVFSEVPEFQTFFPIQMATCIFCYHFSLPEALRTGVQTEPKDFGQFSFICLPCIWDP